MSLLFIIHTRDVTIWVNAIYYCVLPLSVLQYIAVLQYVVRLIKEHIISLKLAKKLSRNITLYCIFLVQSSLQCNSYTLEGKKCCNILQCVICDWLWENPSLTHLVIFQEIPFQNILPIQTPYRQ